jgi:hypothetical protein
MHDNYPHKTKWMACQLDVFADDIKRLLVITAI